MCKIVLDGFSGILDIQQFKINPSEDPGTTLHKGMHAVNTQVSPKETFSPLQPPVLSLPYSPNPHPQHIHMHKSSSVKLQ